MSQFGKRPKAQQRRLILEQLETRSVPSGFAWGGAGHIHPLNHVVVYNTSPAIHSQVLPAAAAAPQVHPSAQFQAHTNNAPAKSHSEGTSGGGSTHESNDSGEKEDGEGGSIESDANELTLSANLADPTGASSVTGSAKFKSEQENGTTVTSFRVRVKGAAPGASLDVAIDGKSVGSITADASGNGTLLLSSNPENGKASPLPSDFPTVKADSVVTVGGTVTGSLATPQQTGSEHSHEKDD